MNSAKPQNEQNSVGEEMTVVVYSAALVFGEQTPGIAKGCCGYEH
jgi:hypothetical protein